MGRGAPDPRPRPTRTRRSPAPSLRACRSPTGRPRRAGPASGRARRRCPTATATDRPPGPRSGRRSSGRRRPRPAGRRSPGSRARTGPTRRERAGRDAPRRAGRAAGRGRGGGRSRRRPRRGRTSDAGAHSIASSAAGAVDLRREAAIGRPDLDRAGDPSTRIERRYRSPSTASTPGIARAAEERDDRAPVERRQRIELHGRAIAFSIGRDNGSRRLNVPPSARHRRAAPAPSTCRRGRATGGRHGPHHQSRSRRRVAPWPRARGPRRPANLGRSGNPHPRRRTRTSSGIARRPASGSFATVSR